MFLEIIKFIFYSFLIVVISKYVLVKILRKLAEALDLSARTVGNIAGIATSIPEFLTVSFSAAVGLIGTSVYNIISSNVINLVQYLFSIFFSKNQKAFRNRAITVDLVLVILTIIIPIIMIILKAEFKLYIVPIFTILFILFYYINNNAHKLYLKKQDKEIGKDIEKEKKFIKGKITAIIMYTLMLLLTGVGLFIVGNALSDALENLAVIFNVSEVVLGIILGFVTSIPELITFFEAQKHHKKQENSELGVIEATNNLLSSNLLNLFFIQSVGIIIYTIAS